MNTQPPLTEIFATRRNVWRWEWANFRYDRNPHGATYAGVTRELVEHLLGHAIVVDEIDTIMLGPIRLIPIDYKPSRVFICQVVSSPLEEWFRSIFMKAKAILISTFKKPQ